MDDYEKGHAAAVLLYSKIADQEKELRTLLKKKSFFDKSVVVLRNSIRDEYEELLFLDFDFAFVKDVEQSLWKTVFYKVIEEFRKRIRKFMPQPGQKQEKTTPTGSKEELHKLCESFKTFLHLATKFYQELIAKFQSRYNLKLDGSVDVRLPSDKKKEPKLELSVHKSYLSCHRCLIFLGDLARYHRDLHGHSAQKDWTKAGQYYQQALQLVPDNGNPHNQLAVLATYADDEFNAVYHYFLSLAVSHPFVTAKDNLSVLFEKNKQKATALDESSPTSKGSKKKVFYILFVQLHGLLFSKTNMESFDTLKEKCVQEWDALLQSGEVTEDVALKVMAVNIFSIFNINHLSMLDNPNPSYAEISQRSVLGKVALQFAFSCFHKLVGATIRNADAPHLPSITVFLDFLRVSTDCLKALGDPTYRTICQDLVRFCNLYADQQNEDISDTLPEELALRGFLPLQSLYRELPANMVLKDEDEVLQKRITKVLAFATAATDAKILFFDKEQCLWFLDPLKAKSSKPTSKAPRQVNPSLVDHIAKAVEQQQSAPDVPTDAKAASSDIITHSNSFMDDVDDEVILFKPGEGAKLDENDNHNYSAPRPAIGSGRSERSDSSSAVSTSFNPNFDLFGASNPLLSNTSSLFSTFQSPSVSAQTQQAFAPSSFRATSPTFNSFFGPTVGGGSSGQTSPVSYNGGIPPAQGSFSHWSSSPARSDPASFFASVPPVEAIAPGNGSYGSMGYMNGYNAAPQQQTQQQNVTSNTPLSWLGQPQSGMESFESFNSSSQHLFPFPGGQNNQQRNYKTRNPFIS